MNRRQFLATLGLTSMSLAACTARPGAAPAATPAKAPDPRTLIIGSVEEPDILNPFLTGLFTTQKIMYGVMSPLVNYDTKLNVIPALAESHTISPDGLTYTFHLRKNVKWHDGTPFGARDVEATIGIFFNKDLFPVVLPFAEKIDSVKTPDDFTVIVTLKSPLSSFIAAVGNGVVAPKHLIDKGAASFKEEFGRMPIGTGPFKFVKWDSGSQIVLEKNPEFYGGPAQIDRIVFKIVPDSNTLINQLKTGEVHMTDALSASDYAVVSGLPNLNVLTQTGMNWQHINLKNLDLLTDKRVRQALDYATPKQQIVDKLLNGLAVVAVADQSPITPYFNPNIKPRPYDLDKAAGLLSDAGFKKNADGIWAKDGTPLKLEYWRETGNTQAVLVSEAVMASWRKLGVEVTVHEQEIRLWMSTEGYFFRKAMTAGQLEFYNIVDPDDMYYWNSISIPAKAGALGGNIAAFFNKFERQDEFDRLTSAGAAEIDLAKRKEIYFKIQELLHEEVPVIFLYWAKRVFAAPKALRYETSAAMPLLFNVESWRLE